MLLERQSGAEGLKNAY